MTTLATNNEASDDNVTVVIVPVGAEKDGLAESQVEQSDESAKKPQAEAQEQQEAQGQDEAQDQEQEEPPSGPYVRYRKEYRDMLGDLLNSQETYNKPAQAAHELASDATAHEPVFEVITTYRTRIGTSKDAQHVVSLLSKPQVHMNIFSAAVINALHSVVQYYPTQHLGGETIEIDWPYTILAHHYDDLRDFQALVKKRDEDPQVTLCDLEANVVEHLDLLLGFLDAEIMDVVREEQARVARGSYTWENLWIGFQPGTVLLTPWRGEGDEWKATVIRSVAGGSFDDPPTQWRVTGWHIAYDGRFLGREYQELNFDRFDGDATPGKLHLIKLRQLDGDLDELPEAARNKIEFGKTYLKLLEKQPRHLKGPSRAFPFNEHDGLVMVDLKDCLDDRVIETPDLMTQIDIRPHAADGTCLHCRRQKRESESTHETSVPLFDGLNQMALDALETDEDADTLICILCPLEVRVFVFKTRQWEPVHVQHLSEPQFDEKMIEGLVMDDVRKMTLTSLAKSFARRNKEGGEMKEDIWSADFVRGKGSGLIFLLHGRPGVGKTCTAECIAAFSRRPLMILTPSDIGTTPADVEANLTKLFKRAMSWQAVLLIDEADVFMERRSTSDLVRNSLVAGFLRALENYSGILFLTTNRVGQFDDAFVSRVHIQLYYPEFSERERQLVWKTFVEKLHRERGNYIRLNAVAKEYIGGSEMRAVQWNGREIRNALQTAVALAEYDAQKDDEGTILVTDTHLKAVVELSADFKKYLDELHLGNEAKRAERNYERLDDFGTPVPRKTA